MDEILVSRVMGEALVERGLMTPEAVAADHAALELRLNGGVPPEPPSMPSMPSTPSAPSQPSGQTPKEADPLMAAAFEGPSSPAAYQFDVPFGAKIDANAFEQERSFREFFCAEGIPTWMAQEANRLALKGAANPPSPAQVEEDRQQGMVQLSKLWGQERDANLLIARREIDRLALARPELINLLERTNLANSAWLCQQLVNLARAKGRA